MKLKSTLRRTTELGVALTAIATLILAGCGGGGSSNSSGGSSVATTTTTVTPYKGMFTSGTVTLVDANGNAVTLSAGGTINASGVASITYPANVAYPLTVNVTGTYLNETAGGASAVIAAGSPLQGLIPSTTEAASGVPVTAVTHVARTMLPASGFSAASAVAAITGAASSVLGISSYSQAMLPPVFNNLGQTTDPTTIKLAALANVIGQQGAGADLGAKLHDIANKLAAGSAVTAVIPQASFDAALAAVNQIGGASGVVPVGATAPTIPPITLPGTGLNTQISALIPTCTTGQVLQLTASGLTCVSGGTVAPSLTCNTSLFAGGVRDATAGELAAYAQTYSGNTGSFDQNMVFTSSGNATLVFSASGALTYNTQAQTVTSICYETAVPQLVVHFGSMGHVDLNTNGDFTGFDGANVIRKVTAPAATAPAAPTGVTATATSATQINLTWSAVADATSYNIYRGTAAGVVVGAASKINTSTVPATSFNDTNLTAATAYFYIVTAVNAAGESVGATEVNATTLATAPTSLAIPTGVIARGNLSGGQIDLSWNAVSGASGYLIYRSTTSNQAITAMTDVLLGQPTTGLTYSDTGLIAGTTYYYKIVATTSQIASQASAQAFAPACSAVAAGGTAAITMSAPFNCMDSIAGTPVSQSVSQFGNGAVTLTLFGGAGGLLITHQTVAGIEVLQVNVGSLATVISSLNSGATAVGGGNCAIAGAAPLCSSLGIAFDRAAGTVSFANTPLVSGLSGSGTTLFTVSGNLSFPPF